jgi:membrane associated rhomboid family serine protease
MESIDIIVTLILLLTVSAFVVFGIRRLKSNTQEGPLLALVKNKALRPPYATAGLSILLLVVFIIQPKEDDLFASFIHNFQAQGSMLRALAVGEEYCGRFEQTMNPICVKSKSVFLKLHDDLEKKIPVSVEEYKAFAISFDEVIAELKKSPNVAKEMATGPPYLKHEKEDQREALITTQKQFHMLTSKSVNPLTLTAAQFTHASWTHLISNIVTLIFFGLVVETWLGSAKFLMIYFLGGFIGLLSYSLIFLHPPQALLGASANISAIVGAYAIFRLKVWPTWKHAPYKARGYFALILEILWMIYFLFSEDIRSIMENRRGIANRAHIIGAVIGVVIAFYFARIDTSWQTHNNQQNSA